MKLFGVLVAIALMACDSGLESYGDDLTDSQVPARGSTDIQTWLAAGYYLGWHCEAAPHPARPPGAHGVNRICTNDVMAAADGTGPFPVGAAAVKELVRGGSVAKWAVYRKVEAGSGGDTWYWYEGGKDDFNANGEGEDGCTGCHSGAPRDFAWTVVR
jgi:hypothetical protein